jgi:hypothetical protein
MAKNIYKGVIFEDEEDYEFEMMLDGYEEGLDLREEFQSPGSNSALRKATKSNPRVHSCPTCGTPNALTAKDKALGYQCDACADRAEGGWQY